MNKKRITTVLILALIAFALYRSRDTSSNVDPVTKTNYLMGTIVNLTVYQDIDESIFSGAFDIVKDIESKMSLNIDGSEIDNINKNAGISPVEVSSDTFNVIEKSIYYSGLSDGKFDISSGGLVKLWDIGGENARVPSPEEIEKELSLIDYRDIVLDKSNSTVMLSNPQMMLDLGGIAKGYAADRVADYLKSNGVEKAIVDIGGNLFLLGYNQDESPWSVGIQNPFSESRNEYIGVFKTSDASVVTSGVYERFLEADGVRYHHILDPDTGYPSENELMGVTISCKDSIDADGLSTSVFLLGLERGMELVESLDGVEAIFVTESKDIYLSSGIDDRFEIKDTNFKIKK